MIEIPRLFEDMAQYFNTFSASLLLRSYSLVLTLSSLLFALGPLQGLPLRCFGRGGKERLKFL